MVDDNRSIHISDFIEKSVLEESDILIIEDSENTKKVTLLNLIKSMVSDNEVPATYRIYSSDKIQNLIDELDKLISDKVGSVEGAVENLEKNTATIKELEDIKKYLEDELSYTINSDEFIKAIETKRDKNVKISADDLDTSSDGSKIKLENLSEEVISAMTGNTIVIPTNKAPIGGWVTEDLADGSISFNKLARAYRFGGNITEGNINEITKDGVYILGPNVFGLPKMDNEDGNNSRILDVVTIGDKLIMQSVYYCDDLENRPIYKRKGEISKLHVLDFIETYEVNNTFKINSKMLSDDFSNCGIISSGNIFSLRKEGNYYAKSTVKNLPTEEDYLITVSKYDDRYIFDAKLVNSNVCRMYTSLLYFTTGQMPVNTSWFKIGSTERSKFEGKKVCLFGDGIIFGLGSDDYANKSIPGYLSKKYGMIINNRALGDATIGNYNNEDLSEKSVIKQIETTDLSDTDYVIIMAGTNDWRYGCNIGNTSEDITDKHFKGSINAIISNILNKNPKVKILICSPIFRSRIEYGDNKDSDTTLVNDRYLSDFVNAMDIICEINHIPYINLMRTSGINKYTASTYLKDGLYPNNSGHELLADKIIDAMNLYY